MSRKVFVSSDISCDDRLIDVASEHPQAALLWPWLLTALDDWGRCEASAKQLKARTFPMIESVTVADVETALTLFAANGLIELYEVASKWYAAVPLDKWFRYQTHIRAEKRESDKSRYPAPPSAQVRASARDVAQSRALAVDCIPSPSPSPSPSSTVDTTEEDSLSENNAAAHAPALTLGALALSPSSSPAPTPTLSPSQPAPFPSPSPSPVPAPAAKVVPLNPVTQPVIGKPARAPDLLWEACVAACGGVAPSNKVERGKWNKGLSALRESGATPEEIAIRATRYKRRYGEQIALNPMALAGNWTTLATEVTDTYAHTAYSARSRASGNGRSGAGGSGSPRGSYGAYTGQHLPDAEEWREWARRERAAGRNIIGG